MSDALHSILADNVRLSVAGAAQPAQRVIMVQDEDRYILVAAEDKTIMVQ